MSELKAYKNIEPVFNTEIQKDAVAAEDYDGNGILFEESDEIYLKSEADKFIADLEESHKKEVEQLLMEIAGLKKLVETADKLLKPKGGFTIKDVTFGGVELEGIKTHKKDEAK